MQNRLFTAIVSADVTGVQVCLDFGANANKVVLEQWHGKLHQANPLLLACRGNMSEVDRVKIIDKLLAAGADPALVLTSAMPIPRQRPSNSMSEYYDRTDYDNTMQAWYMRPMQEVIAPMPVCLQAIFSGKPAIFERIISVCDKESKNTIFHHSITHNGTTIGVLDMACMSPKGLKVLLDNDVAADSMVLPLSDLVRLSPESKRVVASARMRQSIRRVLSSEFRRPVVTPAVSHTIDGGIQLVTVNGQTKVLLNTSCPINALSNPDASQLSEIEPAL